MAHEPDAAGRKARACRFRKDPPVSVGSRRSAGACAPPSATTPFLLHLPPLVRSPSTSKIPSATAASRSRDSKRRGRRANATTSTRLQRVSSRGDTRSRRALAARQKRGCWREYGGESGIRKDGGRTLPAGLPEQSPCQGLRSAKLAPAKARESTLDRPRARRKGCLQSPTRSTPASTTALSMRTPRTRSPMARLRTTRPARRAMPRRLRSRLVKDNPG
ncbi:uncharacterized protein B0H18DRAFT_164564 [Fomitopsis serialis]|uniref:uncharacterized protein n=1 Tax=Fomitopsis serialis TaxID=139415 RepID=UPI0020088EA6|nr:uncharacterized protein B0H18DRAFT_164564 [Neoantrodia serialis]KAH9913646.1 hypothetical protein B0H18DRAFT_164564 [Neoantrodia serialis]